MSQNDNDQREDLQTRRIQSEIAKNEEQVLRSQIEREQLLKKISLPWYKRMEFFQILSLTVIFVALVWFCTIKLLTPLRLENELIRSDLNRLQADIAAKANKDAAVVDSKIKELNARIKSLEQYRRKQPRAESFVPPRVDPVMLHDYAIEQERVAIIADLSILASKAQRYYATSVTLGGGGRSFVELTTDPSGLALLALPSFTDNANGTYTIRTAGNAYRVIFRGVGKIALTNGTFPTYDMTVTSVSQVPTKIN